MEPYSSYRPSGHDWLGDYPTHWQFIRFKYLVDLVNEKDDGQLANGMRLALENIEGFSGRIIPSEGDGVFEGVGNKFRANDVLFGKLRPYLGKVIIAPFDGTCVSDLLVIRPKTDRLTSTFLLYRLLSKTFIREVNSSTFGSKMPRASWEFIGNLRIPLPQLSEQQAIAAYLDDKTCKIDTLIEKKQRLIGLLKEQRTAVINQAVTKGINPNVKMKYSGIGWLGEIPEHWELSELKWHWRIIDCKHRTATYTDDGIPILSTTEIKPGRINLTDTRKTSKEEYFDLISEGRKPKKGDIIYSRNASLGSSAFVETDEEFCMGQDVCLITSDRQNQLFLSYQLNSPVVLNQLDTMVVGATFKRINIDQIRKILVLCPPVIEQVDIARHLDSECERIQILLVREEKAVACLQEYRTALISEVVTGKIDVRDDAIGKNN